MENGFSGEPVAGATAVATAPPRVRVCEIIEAESYARRQRSIVVRHVSDDRIVALIEILSPGNKSSYNEFRSFLAKAVDAIVRGHHLLLVDLQPRTARDPDGIHAIICAEFGGTTTSSPPDKPLTLVCLRRRATQDVLLRAGRGRRRADRYAAVSRSGMVRLRPAGADLSGRLSRRTSPLS